MAKDKQGGLPVYVDPGPFSVTAQGHELTFFAAGEDRLIALIEMIESAQVSLRLFFYMFQQDAAGALVRDALATASKRGVDVCLIVDRFGTDAPDAFFDPIIQNGGHFAVFGAKFTRRYLIRNHQKMCIADGTSAMVGGFNISDSYFAAPSDDGWKDLACRISGPVVGDLARWFGQLRGWIETPGSQYRAMRKLIREWKPSGSKSSGSKPSGDKPSGDKPSGDKACLTLGGPTRAPSNWARRVRRDLAGSSRLDMAMAYFSPPRSFRQLIRRLAERGEARLVLAGKSDNSTTIGAARAIYGGLLKSGARIFEFQPCKLHMKLIVLDDVVYFGSANFDHRSIRLNLEMMFRFEDAELAMRMRALIDDMANASLEITPQLHRNRRNPWSLLKWWLGWTLVSVLDYTVTRRLNIGG